MESGYGGVERRRHKRVKVRLSVVFRKNEPLDVRIRTLEGETKAQMVDISESGMAIMSNVDMPIATVLWIRFTLSKAEKQSVSFYGNAEVLGKVVNSAPQGQDAFRLGISFVEVDDVSRREIANFVSILEQPE